MKDDEQALKDFNSALSLGALSKSETANVYARRGAILVDQGEKSAALDDLTVLSLWNLMVTHHFTSALVVCMCSETMPQL